MPLQRCFSSLGCPDLGLDETLALATRHGIAAVELRALGGTLDLPAYLAQHYGTPGRLAEHLRHSPVRIAALGASLRVVGATPAEREQLSALAPWADALGAGWLRVFDGGERADDAEVADALRTLGWWRDQRRENGWRTDLAVETHDSLLDAAAIARLLSRAPGLALVWDAHHTWRKGGEDPLRTWPAVRASVVHVHVKDSIGVPGPRHPFTYVLPGDGGFPIAPLLEALGADRYEGCVSLEWERQWHPYLPSLDEALCVAAERRWW
jgi:sugar phosphate isomerase/epimerase